MPESVDYESLLSELTGKVDELQQRVSAFNEQFITPIDKAVGINTDRQDVIKTEMEALVRELMSLRNDKRAAERDARKLAQDLDSLLRQRQDCIAAITAKKRLDEVSDKLEAIFANSPWAAMLRDYQRDDLVFITSVMMKALEDGKKAGVLNANPMGAGKTFEAAAAIEIFNQLFYAKFDRLPRVLWLTKKSLVKSNAVEISKRNAIRTIPIVAASDKDSRNFLVDLSVANNAVLVMNYDALATTPNACKVAWDMVVMDEVHRLKGGANASGPTQIFTRTKEVCEKALFVLPLSGTPIVNRPQEMWTYLHIFNPERFPDVKLFTSQYQLDRWEDGVGNISWDKLVKTALAGRVITRSEAELNLQLPDLEEIVYLLDYADEPEQLAFINQIREQFFMELEDKAAEGLKLSFTAIIAMLTRYGQASIWPGAIEFNFGGEVYKTPTDKSVKINFAMEKIEELIELGERVVVYTSRFNKPLDHLAELIAAKKWKFNGTDEDVVVETITGSVSANLSDYEQRFQSGSTHVLLVNLKTGGEGLNLQKSNEWVGGSSHCIFLDKWWTPAANQQGIKRLHRQGQTHPTFVHTLHVDQSIDDLILAKLEKKAAMIAGIMEDESLNAKDWVNQLKGLI